VIVFLYVAAILAGNWLSSMFAPVNIGPFLISLGTFTIGATFILRDLVQRKHGRFGAYVLIFISLGLSVIMSLTLKNGLPVVFASAVAFLISETTDTEIYTKLKLPVHWRVWWSGFVGGILDSTVFIVLGLSPWGMGFMPWSVVPMAIIGQSLIKLIMQAVGAGIVKMGGNK